MNSYLFSDAMTIVEKLVKAGYEAFIVGGAVRDYLLQKEIKDIDIATSATTEEVKALFSKTIDVAIKHGTVIVRSKGCSYEVTSFRGKSLYEDLAKRDFTINALAFSNSNEIIDPFLGQEDLAKGCIRGVENPYERFREDPLRMLRAIRFVSILSFDVEKKTQAALKELSSNLNNCAIERVASEFEKICLGKNIQIAFQYLHETRLIAEVSYFKEIRAILNQESAISLRSLTNMTEIWVFLLFTSGNHHLSKFLRSWKQPKKLIAAVEVITARLPKIIRTGFTDEDLYVLGIKKAMMAERVRAVIANCSGNLEEINQKFDKLPIKHLQEIEINGKDILTLLPNLESKQRIGTILALVETAVLTRAVANERQAIINWLREKGHTDA